MKKLLLVFGLIISATFFSCSSNSGSDTDIPHSEKFKTETRCGTYNGKHLYTGPRGGCYYYNSNKNKTYVDRKECDCF